MIRPHGGPLSGAEPPVPPGLATLATAVFTDLDDTLLDQEGAVDVESTKLIYHLVKSGIPVVPVTSKTAAEVQRLRADLELDGPYVVENGSAIHDWPGPGESTIWGPNYGEVRQAFIGLKRRYPLVGFGDISVSHLSRICSFDVTSAENAKNRSSSEPFFLTGGCDFERLRLEVEKQGFRIASGGRFFCLQGAQNSKGRAIEHLTHAFAQSHREKPTTIGVGHAPNDVSMLRAVSIAVVMPDHCLSEELKAQLPHAYFSQQPSWSGIVCEALGKLTATEASKTSDAKENHHV
ncbi:MAG: HAD hydrolase family protein [Acidobacteriota bacterium]